MFKSKKFYIILGIIIGILLIGTKTLGINARIIILEEDDNPDGYTDFLYNEKEYFIDINDEEGTGYLVYSEGNIEYIVGTCKVVIIDDEHLDGYIACTEKDGMKSFGTITVEMNKYDRLVEGDISDIYIVNDVILILR